MQGWGKKKVNREGDGWWPGHLLTFCLWIGRWLCQWYGHVTVRTSRFEFLCNFVGKITHKNFHIIALLCVLKFFIFRLGFPLYILMKCFYRYIQMVLARELIQSVSITAKYRQKILLVMPLIFVEFLVMLIHFVANLP